MTKAQTTSTQAPPAPPQAVPPPRSGPRPLPLHLGIATLACLSSPSGLPHLKAGSTLWKGALAERAAALAKALNGTRPEDFRAEVEAASRARLKRFLAAVDGYRHHPYRRSLADPPTLWQAGASRLLDYGRAPEATDPDGPAVLFAPSLVNRGYVLDLSAERSLLRDLARRGFRPLLIEWGAPGPAEHALGLDDYIIDRLGGCLDAIQASNGGAKVVLVGYCMGGLLALAAALRRRDALAGLALLATPWDFHADGGGQAKMTARLMAPAFPVFERLGAVPVDVLQMLFASLDPLLALRKFLDFSRFDPDSERVQAFVALEDWLNDGVALPVKVARDCIEGWYGENLPARGAWQVGGEAVSPGALDLPTLVIVPESDRIVPPASAGALAAAIPGATVLTPPAGHIGMIVGSKGRTHVWGPLADWLGGLGG